MDFWFWIKCFFVGVSASSAVGPIFILTFNRGALYGFTKGFACALGSALVDAIFFALGLFGALTLVQNSQNFMLIMDCVGGFVLIVLGAHTLKKQKQTKEEKYLTDEPAIISAAKSFLVTIINPFVILFFMFISVQILPEGITRVPLDDIIAGSIMVSLGSLCVLSCVAWFASQVGKAISPRMLKKVSYTTGLLFIGVGVYFIGDFVLNILRLYA